MFILYLGNGLFRSVFGLFYDYLGFKKLMVINSLIVLLISSTFYFFTDIRALVFIEVILTSTIAGSQFSLIPAGLQEIYGEKYSYEVYGGTFYCFGISSLVTPILIKILDFSDPSYTIPYMIIYLVGSLFSIIGLVLIYFLDMTPYEYSYY